MTRIRRTARWLWAIGDRTVKVRYAGLAIVLTVFAILMTQVQIDSANDRARRIDARLAAAEVNDAQFAAYQAQLATYEACLIRVQGRLDVRDVLLYLVDLPQIRDSNAARTFRAYVDEKLPTLDPADCHQPPLPQPAVVD